MRLGARSRIVSAGVSCGLLYWLAMPGVGFWPLAFVAFLPLYLFESQRAVASLTAGFVAGMVATLGVCAWLPASTQLMLGASAALGGLALAVLCVWHGTLFALVGLLNQRARAQGVPGWLSLSLSLVAAELLISLPFPFSFAVALHSLPLLIQIAELAGRLGIVFVLGATTAALGDAWRVLQRGSTPRAAWKSVGFGLLPLVASLLYGAVRMPQIERRVANAPKLAVGLVQPNVAPWLKRADPAQSLNEHVALTRELLSRERTVDLVVWSETAVSMPLDERQVGIGLRRRFGEPFRVPLLLGVVIERRLGEPETPRTNSALLSTGEGYVCPECRYDKQSLMPVTEATLPKAPFASPGKFDVGSRDHVLPFDGNHTIGALICFEAIFPERVRQLVRREHPQLLVNVSNDGWFGDTGEPRLHLALAKLRAVEHRLFFVRVAGTGISAIVDPLGRTSVSLPAFVRGTAVGSVAWLDANTYYDALGDRPWWLLAFAIVCAGTRWVRQLRWLRVLTGHSRADMPSVR